MTPVGYEGTREGMPSPLYNPSSCDLLLCKDEVVSRKSVTRFSFQEGYLFMATLREAVIVDAVRTPEGRRNGKLKDWHPVDLLAQTLQALVQRTGIDPTLIDDVIAGCVSQVGEQAYNVAR